MSSPSHISLRGFFLLLTLILGAAILSHYVDYQLSLSTGDHGLLLYAAEANLRGELPYHDYHYFYGPLMTYYYSLFMLVFGKSIVSVLIGQQFLFLISGLLLYAALSLLLSPYLSFAGAIWFWVFNKEFFYTYNHIGIIAASLAVLYCVFHYYRFGRKMSLYLGLCFCVTAGLIKLNFGFSLLACMMISALLICKCYSRKLDGRFLASGLLAAPLAIIISNGLFILGLPFYIIKQCYQYFGNDALAGSYPSTANIIAVFLKTAQTALIKYWQTEFILVIIAIIGLANVYMIKKKQTVDFDPKQVLVVGGILVVFYALNLHEYLISGINFRTFYSFPFFIMLLFFVIGHFGKNIPRPVQITLVSMVCFIVLAQLKVNLRQQDMFRKSLFYLPVDKAKIFTGNRLPWQQTMTQTVLYLKENLAPGELFLALPYDPLYYFLADRKSPTRQLALFKFLDVQPEQDREIIDSLKIKNVKWVLLSNRAITVEASLGMFGRDYCPLLAGYIDENYVTVASFGVWTPAPSWAWFHGTKILKRKY